MRVEAFDRLSDGTREPIAVLVQPAFGQMLIEQGTPATVIVDDAPVFSDDDRIGLMFDTLNMAAGKSGCPLGYAVATIAADLEAVREVSVNISRDDLMVAIRAGFGTCRLFGLSIALTVLIAASSLHADPSLNCGAYATKAVEQQKWNQFLACGLRGGAWSTDFNGHVRWCNLANVRMADLTREDNRREAAVQECRERFRAAQAAATGQQERTRDILCGQYGIDARTQNQENHEFKCGLQGGRWSNDVNGHRAWCMRAGWDAAQAERAARNTELNACKAKAGRCTRESDCGAYLCNEESGLCYTSCKTTQDHCAPDRYCDTDSRCKRF